MKLSDVVNRINGNVDRFTTDLEYYIGGEHFDSCELEISRKGLIKPNLNILGFKFHFAFQERDVIFMARNPHLRKAGMVFFSGLCSDASYILRSKNEAILTQEYLAVMLQSDHFWDYCEAHKVGSVNFAINWKTMANYEFDLPTIEQQKIVAEKVWAAYRLKQSYRNLISATDEIVKSQFIEMFGQVSEDSPCLNDIARVYDGTHKTPTYTESGIPFISVENISDVYGSNKYISNEDYDLYKHKPEYGDIFMTRIGSIGKCAVYESHDPLAYYVSLALIKPNKDIVHPKFLKYYIESTDGALELKKRSLLKAFPMKINLGEIGKIKVIVPAKDKQLEFVKVAEQADKSKLIRYS